MESSDLKLQLDNARLYSKVKKFQKEINLYQEEKIRVKDLIVEYKNALDTKTQQIEVLQKEKNDIEDKYNKIPEFVRNFFQE